MKLTFSREIDIRREVDVSVAGGGPAGMAAAITAARAGDSVFVAEGGSAFGGMGTLGLVPAFMPLDDGVNLLCAGIGTEVVRRMLSPEGEYNADLPLDTHLVDVAVSEGRVEAVVLWGKSGFKCPCCGPVHQLRQGDPGVEPRHALLLRDGAGGRHGRRPRGGGREGVARDRHRAFAGKLETVREGGGIATGDI